MQVYRVDVVAGIAHSNAVALALMKMKRRRRHHLVHRVGNAVDGPLIEAVERGVLLFEEHVEYFVRCRGCGGGIAEVRVVPLERLRWNPLWLALIAGVLNHDAHTMVTVVISQVSHDPDSGMIHFYNGGDALRRA